MPPSPILTPAGRAVLVKLVSGSKLDHVPGELVELKLVESARFKTPGGMVGLFWVATKAGVIAAANIDDASPPHPHSQTPQPSECGDS